MKEDKSNQWRWTDKDADGEGKKKWQISPPPPTPPGGKSSTCNILFLYRSTIIWNIWMHGRSEKGVFFFPFFFSSFSFFSSLHLMGLILPLHFAVLSWQGSQSSQHLLLMPLTGGYLLPYMFSLQLHHGRPWAAKQRRWDADGHLFD